jgi:hypothetical protein
MPIKATARRWGAPGPQVLSLALFAVCPLRAQDDLALPQRDGPSETNSPEESLASLIEPGLSDTRATPVRAAPAAPDSSFVPLFRLVRPYYDSIFAALPPEYAPPSDPASFRPVLGYQQPLGLLALGLQPRVYRAGLVEFYPSAGLSQSFDSNVDLTSTHRIADSYITPRAALELQVGSPDSVWSDGYDTILGLHASYEAYGDIFFENPHFDAFNQRFSLNGRIGRSNAIWRPYFYYSDVTGTDLLTAELTNRTRRIRLSPGFIAEYKLTQSISWTQSFGYFHLDHPDPSYVNVNAFQTRQDLGYRVLNETRALLWTGYRYTAPDRGSAGSEYFLGAGWSGKPDPRLYTEMHLGYGFLELTDPPPGIRHMAGLRFNGYTTFQWGPRFDFTLIYDRDYIFNEQGINDNYVATLLQFKGEFYLGDHWYITPYLGFGLNQFQISDARTVQIRPELEISYALPSDTEANTTRAYVKFGYSHSANLVGVGEPVDGLRVSFGVAWKY